MPTVFDTYHPGIAAAYFAAVLVLLFAGIHPVLVAVGLVTGFAYSIRLRGLRAALGTFAWQLPLLLIVAVLNPFFSASGSTLIATVLGRPIFLESLAYGFTMGGLLVAVLLWFSNASQVLTSDKVMALAGGRMATLGLMLTMVMRLVPQFVRRGEEIDSSRKACTAAAGGSSLKLRARQVSVLAGWSMEDSLETSQAMLARGWGSAAKRTAYSRKPFRAADGLLLALLLVLLAACVAAAVAACEAFRFYPSFGQMVPLPTFLPFALLCIAPMAADAVQSIRWRTHD